MELPECQMECHDGDRFYWFGSWKLPWSKVMSRKKSIGCISLRSWTRLWWVRFCYGFPWVLSSFHTINNNHRSCESSALLRLKARVRDPNRDFVTRQLKERVMNLDPVPKEATRSQKSQVWWDVGCSMIIQLLEVIFHHCSHYTGSMYCKYHEHPWAIKYRLTRKFLLEEWFGYTV